MKLALASWAGSLLVIGTIVATLPRGSLEFVALLLILIAVALCIALAIAFLPWMIQFAFGSAAAIWSARIEKIVIPVLVLFLIYSSYKGCTVCDYCMSEGDQNIDNDASCRFLIFEVLFLFTVSVAVHIMLSKSQEKLSRRYGWQKSTERGA